MATFWILFAVLQVFSLSFTFLSLWRLYHYIHRYRFDESKYTLLLGFIHLRWVAIIYLVFTLLWIPVSYLILSGF